MKIRQKLRDHAKRLAREQKNLCLESARPHRLFLRLTAGNFLRNIFKSSDHRGANRENRSSVAARSPNRSGRRFWNFVRFRMNLMIFQSLGANRLKRAQAHIERDFADLDSALAQTRKHRLRKMQAGRRRSDSAAVARKNRLVSLAVERFIFALDVWRQRNMSEPLDHICHAPSSGEF